MDNVNNKLIMERELAKINKDFLESLYNYRSYIKKCEYDAPIDVLCLPKDILNILQRNGLVRVFDIIDLDLTKIKGLGSSRISHINTQLKKLVPM